MQEAPSRQIKIPDSFDHDRPITKVDAVWPEVVCVRHLERECRVLGPARYDR